MATVRDFMTASPVTIASSASVQDAALLMRNHDIGLLPVMENHSFRGVVTDRDIVVRAIAEGRFTDTVGTIISTSVTTLSPDDDVEDAVKLMSSEDVRRLPVCEGSKLVGIVSVGDIATRRSAELAGKVMEETGPTA